MQKNVDVKNYCEDLSELRQVCMAAQSAMASTFENFIGRNDGDFVLAHINCNHLTPHIREMQVRFEGSRVNKTFLSDSVSSWAVAIKSYKFVRNDRTVRGRTDTDGSGVGIGI
jgi:hypothetical protein